MSLALRGSRRAVAGVRTKGQESISRLSWPFACPEPVACTELVEVKGVSRGSNRPLALAEQRFGQLRQFHRGQFDGRLFGVACLLIAADGRDEQRALRWKAARCEAQQRYSRPTLPRRLRQCSGGECLPTRVSSSPMDVRFF